MLRWYVRETYDVEDEKVIRLIKSRLSAGEVWDLKWHVTLVTGKKAVICTRGTHALDKACKPGFAWKPRANLPTGRAASAAAVLDGRIFVIGGWSGAMAVDYVDLGTVEEYWP